MSSVSIHSVKEILPTVDYPPTIRGSLRLILQLKDAFLGCFNLVEEYRDQLLACKHGFTRDLVVYQLTKGLNGIKRLREDLAYVEMQAQRRQKRNKLLRQYLVDRYDTPDAKDQSGAPLGIQSRVGSKGQLGDGVRFASAMPPPIAAPDSIEQVLHGGLHAQTADVNVDELNVPEEMDLATTLTASGTLLMPVVEFYRALYFLQMHFQIIMCQAANYALPVVTQPMSVSDRTFFWPTMPSYGLASKSGGMRDRLVDIHTDVVALATRLHECLAIVRMKMEQDRKIEAYFTRHTAAQENLRRALLRGLQTQRTYIDALESQNDRLAGLAIKLDPSFARSTDFAIMTGPGLNLPEEPFATNQNSAIPGAPVSLRRPDHNEPSDGDPKNGRGGAAGHGGYGPQAPGPRGQSHHDPSQERSRRNNHSSGVNRQQYDRHRRDSYTADDDNAGYYVNDTNTSANGPGRPAIWVQQPTSTYTHSDKIGEINPDYGDELDTELTRKLTQLRGHSQTVEELLIGVDSVASGMGKFATDVGNMATPSYMNTDQYITTMYDEVFGQIPNQRSSKKSATSTWKKRIVTGQPVIQTSSAKSSQVESISPAPSTKHSISTVATNDGLNQHQPVQHVRNDSKRIYQGVTSESDRRETTTSPEGQPGFDTAENTLSEDLQTSQHLDTNVNASHGGLPKLGTASRHPLSRLKRTAKSSPPIRRVQEDMTMPPVPEFPASAAKYKDKFDQGLLNMANEEHLPQVPTVSTAECGFMCVPEWISHRSSAKQHKPEDLLEEPKRSAFTKAVIAHRCRLVETILQADEDRLEEIINVLLKH